MLNAPKLAHQCACGYPIYTSLALVLMPEVETWYANYFKRGDSPVRRVGINFGAPGDRRAPDGTLWLDYPSVGGPSPDVSVKTMPEKPEWFRRHSSRMKGDGLKWVAASGARGLRKVTITLDPDAKKVRAYTVRLHFAEPDDANPGERVFDVAIQGKVVLSRFDIAKEAGGRFRPVVKRYAGVMVRGDLTISLSPSPAGSSAPVLCGVEVVAEGR